MDNTSIHDLIIVGSGPSGYTAGIYAARASLKPLILAGEKAGGQLMLTTVIENWPGNEKGIDGPLLMDEMRKQAERFGATVEYRNVQRVDFSDPVIKKVFVKTKDGEVEYQAKSIILATGADSIMLGIPGEQRLIGRGVSTCAVCDAAFFKDKKTVVIGGGDSAMEDTLALTKFASSVTVIHRRDSFKASKIMQDRVLNNPKVKVMWNTIPQEVLGDPAVTSLKVSENGQEKMIETDGVFLAIGHRPTTEFLQNHVELDDHGYIVTRTSLTQKGIELAQAALNEGIIQFPTMTSVTGVFAAGDVVDVRYKQAITASAQGCQAAIDAERWLEQR
ncbi:MAG: thioredoxin-disulfide reductase [Patescibacteria group bacterium]